MREKKKLSVQILSSPFVYKQYEVKYAIVWQSTQCDMAIESYPRLI